MWRRIFPSAQTVTDITVRHGGIQNAHDYAILIARPALLSPIKYNIFAFSQPSTKSPTCPGKQTNTIFCQRSEDTNEHRDVALKRGLS